MKFKTQGEDPVNGNNFVARTFGPSATRRRKHFRRFFAVQNPVLGAKPRSTHPNWKVQEFLHYILAVSIAAWDCGIMISVDEQAIGFQGRHPDKLHITYKAEGDGFQCDALCSDGYTFAFYFPKEPPLAEYVARGLSPLHTRVIWIFDKLKHNNHRCRVDNLYTSAIFFARHTIILAEYSAMGLRGRVAAVS